MSMIKSLNRKILKGANVTTHVINTTVKAAEHGVVRSAKATGCVVGKGLKYAGKVVGNVADVAVETTMTVTNVAVAAATAPVVGTLYVADKVVDGIMHGAKYIAGKATH